MIDVQLLKSEVQMNEKCDKQKPKLWSDFLLHMPLPLPARIGRKTKVGGFAGRGVDLP